MKKSLIGKKAEDDVFSYIQQQGMFVVRRNYRTRRGEIDLIALDGNVIVFIEVKKMLSSWDAADIGLKINTRKQNCIKQSAMYFLANDCNVKYYNIRFDVAAVVSGNITYYKDAF